MPNNSKNRGYNSWAAGQARSLASGPAVAKARCKRCDKVKNAPDNFSNKQLADLAQLMRSKTYKPGAHEKEGLIMCKLCTSNQVTELYCNECNFDLPLEDFAKAHRRSRDKAVCKQCMEKRLALQPNEPLQEHSSDEDYESSDSNPWGGDDDDVSTTLGDMSITGGGNTSSVQTSEGGIWVPQARTFGTNNFQQPSAFDPMAYGGARRSQATATASNSSNRGPPAAPPVKTSKGGWAKPPKSSQPSYLDDLPSSSEDDDDWKKPQREEDDDSDDSGF